MKILIMLNFILSTSLIHAHHPIMIMVLIITQTLAACLLLWVMLPTAWFSFILFLIFIGGLMVLFIYITSLAANETFTMNMKTSKNQMTFMIILTLIVSTSIFFFAMNMFLSSSLNKQISMIFSNSLSFQTITIMTYLLITLIVVVSISTKMEGPIRNIITQ